VFERASSERSPPTLATIQLSVQQRRNWSVIARHSSRQFGRALYASKICSYAQGFVQLQAASEEHDWGLNYGDCALLWRGGCIIRAQFLDRIKEAFDEQPDLENLLLLSLLQENHR
jgi:6-phosphogluconate dehydrogenase